MMFCDEPVIAVYFGRREYDDIKNANAFFDCFHDIAFHFTVGFRYVLETEHYYLSLGINGVTRHDKNCSIEEFQEAGEWLENCVHTDLDDEEDHEPWIDYEHTLFVGERLLDVEADNNMFLVHFEHFCLKLIPHDPDKKDIHSFTTKNHWSYLHVYGCERLIDKCECGGTGELLLDFVSDYVVQCDRCKKSTCAEMCAINAIEAWNRGERPCGPDDIEIE